MITNGREILKQAKKEGWAVGAFNVSDYDITEMVLRAAEELRVPVMLSIGDYADPNAPETRRLTPFQTKNLMTFIRNRAEASPVPVVIHLDHCPTFDGCVRGIQNGATSVMIDASQEPFDVNVERTLKVKELCKATDVNLEAEIGHVSGHPNSRGVQYTSVEGAKAFYEATGVDLLAISVGTVHGIYASAPSIQYDLISAVNEAIPASIVLHGSSGLSPEQFRDAVKAGISKINFATYLYREVGIAMYEYGKEQDAAGKPPMWRNVRDVAYRRGVEYVKEHLGYFGTRPVTL